MPTTYAGKNQTRFGKIGPFQLVRKIVDKKVRLTDFFLPIRNVENQFLLDLK